MRFVRSTTLLRSVALLRCVGASSVVVGGKHARWHYAHRRHHTHATTEHDADNTEERDERPTCTAEDLDLFIKAFVERHSTLEAALTEMPSDGRFLGRWPGLVLRYDLLILMAKAYSNSNGEVLERRLDLTGSHHQKVPCVYGGQSRRRKEVGRAKRLRPTMRENCSWGANITILNFHKIRGENPGKDPKELIKYFFPNISKWNAEYSNHVATKQLE